jgi:hypothetical protein
MPSYIISVQKANLDVVVTKKSLDFPVYNVMELRAQTNKMTLHHAKIYQQTPEENF